jgi:hypothetical protein
MRAPTFAPLSPRFLLSALFLCGSAADSSVSVRAQAPRGQDAQPRQEAENGREARRVLHLSSGQTIRVLSRAKEETWEYHGKEGWKTLAPGAVLSAELESDVLREWKAKKSQVAPTDLSARTQLADWALSAGLAVEGLEEMTAVLALDPDRKEALDSLAAHAEVMSVPSLDVPADRLSESLSALLRFGASVPGAARELAVRELGRRPRGTRSPRRSTSPPAPAASTRRRTERTRATSSRGLNGLVM